MNFIEYFNQLQEKFVEDNVEGAVELTKQVGDKTVTYAELESSLSTILQNTALAIEENALKEEIKLNYVLKKLKECGIVSKELEGEILEGLQNIENLLEDVSNEQTK